jgi:menaquinone-9 beta-reductase
MDSCDVLIVGGGPAGSTCAGRLRQAGLDVLLMDRDTFPRHKPCAGWITPTVLKMLGIDGEEYRQGRVLQDIRSFRTGLIGGPGLVTRYGTTVSYGIRRSEFDHYLLQRSGVRQVVGEPVTALERKDDCWIVNGRIRARILVGAGGHYCPVARRLGAKIGRENVIVAQSAEYLMNREEQQWCRVQPDTPELFFCRDMKGYGWLFRKGNYLNIGLGRRDSRHLGRHTREFCRFLDAKGELPAEFNGKFQGHAYLL